MSWRMNPARNRSRWLTASAPAGTSRSVGLWSCDQRMPRMLVTLSGDATDFSPMARRTELVRCRVHVMALSKRATKPLMDVRELIITIALMPVVFVGAFVMLGLATVMLRMTLQYPVEHRWFIL